jgi:hypothetical protein
MTARRKQRAPHTRTVVRLPERALAESIRHLAAPLLETLGPAPAPDEARPALEVAINVWNAHVLASPFWDSPDPRPLAALRKAMCGKQAPPGLADTFELLSARWRAEHSFDPRLVGAWSLEPTGPDQHDLVCETRLPAGVEAEVPPPAEKRIAIGGSFLDEVRIRQAATSLLSFPVENHRGEIGGDGVVTIHTRLPTVVELFAEGLLMPIGGTPVDVMVGEKQLGAMVLAEVRCTGYGGHSDVAVLVFRRASAAVTG